MRRAVLLRVVVAALTLAGAGCTGSDDPGPGATVPQGTTASTPATPSTTPAIPDVSTIPATIDKPYLDAVLKALDEVDGQATRLIKASHNLTSDAVDRLKAIFSDDAYVVEEQLWYEALADDPKLEGVLTNPGNRVTTVDRIIAASAACVWMSVRRDHSAVNVRPGPTDRIEYVAIQPLDASNDPAELNPTAWMITTDGFRSDGQEPDNPCP